MSPAKLIAKESGVKLETAQKIARARPEPSAWALPSLPLLFFQGGPETIATYDSTCTNLKSDFNLGDTVCAKVTNAPVGVGGVPAQHLTWVAHNGAVAQAGNITSSTQTGLYTIPSTATQTLGGVTIDNRGTWRVNTATTSDGSLTNTAYFTVRDPAGSFANLVVNQGVSLSASEVGTVGSNGEFGVHLTNFGPDAAQNVVFTEPVPANTTFVSFTQTSGPTFTCTTPGVGGTGSVSCTIASLAKDQVAEFEFIYQVASASNGFVANTASASSATADVDDTDNSADAAVVLPGGSPPAACSLTCPSDITRTANTTQSGVSGAIVTFGSAEASGECGALSTSPASGTFFPVGQTTVTVNSADNGGVCHFVVTVTGSAAPTISCPATVTKNADNSCTATVTVQELGTPTTTGSNVTVAADRGDGQALDAPYPAGTTTIIWTATDDQGRKASCNQLVTVNANDTTPPTITAPADVTVGTGAGAFVCGAVVPEDTLGTATAADGNCSVSVHITRTGVPAGNLFPKGTTTVTYTATDGSGNTSLPAVQHVTVTDDTPPIIFAPSNASYTCPSEVPTGNPAQATGPIVDANGQPVLDANGDLQPGGPVFDNCGAPAVLVSDTSSGAGSASSPLVITRTFTATDTAGNTASAVQTITVIDNVPPAFTSVPADVTLYTGAGAASCGVTVNDLDATLGTATASDNCAGVTVSRSGGNTFPVGTTTVTYTATDAAGNPATATQHVTVIDNTPPTVTAPANITVGNDVGSCSATLNPGTATTADNCAGVSAASGTRSDGQPLSAPYPKGLTTITWSATDAHGNSASASQTVTVNDTEAPTVSVPANIVVSLPLNSTATSKVVTYTVTAADNCPGVTFSVNPVSGSSFPVGTTTVTATATDAAGNVTTRTFTVTVLYNFTGFFSPVANLPTFNLVNAGRAVPMKFSLSGNKGLNIFAVGSPDSQQIACDSGAPIADLQDTSSAGGSSLSYDAGSDQYNYVWKTDGAWAGTCRQFVLQLNDGSFHYARFKFR